MQGKGSISEGSCHVMVLQLRQYCATFQIITIPAREDLHILQHPPKLYNKTLSKQFIDVLAG
jgi:hypothetical protein